VILDRIELSETEEGDAFAFLKRAVPVILAAGLMPATLSLLDSLVAYPESYGDVSARTPGLPELVREWPNVREHVMTALGADPSGDFDFGFRTYAADETEHWDLSGTPLAGVPVFGLYLFREGEATHLCSFTPSSWAVHLENIFCYPDQDGLPENEYGQTAAQAYLDAESLEGANQESDSYFGYFGERADLDRRHAEKGDVSDRVSVYGSPLRVDLSKLDGFAASPVDPRQTDAFADLETLQAAIYKAAADSAWEEAREYFQGNQICPPVVLNA